LFAAIHVVWGSTRSSFHPVASSRSCRTSYASSGIDGDKPASQRDCPYLRLSRYTQFCTTIPRRFGHLPGAGAGHSQRVGNGTVRASTDEKGAISSRRPPVSDVSSSAVPHRGRSGHHSALSLGHAAASVVRSNLVPYMDRRPRSGDHHDKCAPDCRNRNHRAEQTGSCCGRSQL
jgi:hypothetical protein